MNARLIRDLHAYHDGELRGPRRWLLERRLGGDAEAQDELARIALLGGLLRAQAEEVPTPDLWGRIVMALPATAPAAEPARRLDWGVPQWAGAAVAAAALATVLLLAPPAPPPTGASGGPESSVLMLDTGRRPAFILQDDREATIIWLLQAQTADSEGTDDAMG